MKNNHIRQKNRSLLAYIGNMIRLKGAESSSYHKFEEKKLLD